MTTKGKKQKRQISSPFIPLPRTFYSAANKQRDSATKALR
jgi:hypothetical protein